MQLGAANRITCSAYEGLYPVMWDHMLLKGAWELSVQNPMS